MPEGPELYLSARLVGAVCGDRLFCGAVHEHLPPHKPSRLSALNLLLEGTEYRLSARSRGKELLLLLRPCSSGRPHALRFGFGMTGCFRFTRADQLPKHARVSFYTAGVPRYSLSFVDTRGFGVWHETGSWTPWRGPCIIAEYPEFRQHVLSSLSERVFSRAICEALLDQRFFNGVGNYLRAEVLHRCGIRPFDEARAVLSGLAEDRHAGTRDPLWMCHQLALEVIALGGGRRYNLERPGHEETALSAGDPPETTRCGGLLETGVLESETGNQKHQSETRKRDSVEDEDLFESWLQCYSQPSMKNLVDHQGRTMWFRGDPGPLAPKGGRSRHNKQHKEIVHKGKRKSQQSDVAGNKPEINDVAAVKEERSQKRKDKQREGKKRKLEEESGERRGLRRSSRISGNS